MHPSEIACRSSSLTDLGRESRESAPSAARQSAKPTTASQSAKHISYLFRSLELFVLLVKPTFHFSSKYAFKWRIPSRGSCIPFARTRAFPGRSDKLTVMSRASAATLMTVYGGGLLSARPGNCHAWHAKGSACRLTLEHCAPVQIGVEMELLQTRGAFRIFQAKQTREQ